MSTPSLVTWRLFGITQGLDETDAHLRERACRKLGVTPEALRGFRIAKRSLDARRRRGAMHYNCHVDLVLSSGQKPVKLKRAERSGQVRVAPVVGSLTAIAPVTSNPHVVVVGSGPAGMFAALTLALNGARVTVIDRGARLDQRGKRLAAFRRTGVVDRETNLLFGEGGAGTYSDGKVYTRVDDPLEVPILSELVRAGAPPEILFDARAHIGTDRLHRVLPALRARLMALGVEFVWETRLDGLAICPDSGRVRAAQTTGGEIACDALFLAPGHSARDTWAALHAQGVRFEAKPFQFGVRIEHPQALITRGRFGDGPEAKLLGAASYALVCKAKGGAPGAHSFCMCPGGRIVASVNDAGLLCTNGMSNSTHSSRWANAALVTTFGPADFARFGDGPFAGVAFQRFYERRFFEAGGSDYKAPAQRAPDFLAGRVSTGELATSYGFGATAGRIDELLPERAVTALRRALTRFDRSITGFAGEEALLVGVESRSSGPVRMPRDRNTYLAASFDNLYPIGEGAGHAGGIMSAALDGAHSALAFVRHTNA